MRNRMTRSIFVELPANQAEALDQVAASSHRTPGATAALLVDEALRHERFPQVEFRNSVVGRQAYVVGSNLAVWEVVMIAECYAMDSDLTASHLAWAPSRVSGILAYAGAFPEEVRVALAENRSVTEERVRLMLPNARWA